MNSHILAIQTALKEAGFYTGETDGIAGKLTVEAVNKAIVTKKCDISSDETDAIASHASTKDSGFVLSERSLKNLEGVNPTLVKVVKRAIQITNTDFAVIEGLRTKERQKELVRKGASKTMNSRHLTGHAVDIAPVIDGTISWKFEDYYPLVEAMRQAANELSVRIRWGGAWQVITNSKNHPSELVKAYRASGGRFTDGPHFELPA